MTGRLLALVIRALILRIRRHFVETDFYHNSQAKTMTFTPGSTSWASPLRLRGGEGDGDVFTSSPKRARETQMIVAIPPGHVNGSETRRSPPGFALP